jgi:hypothetical protein
VAEGKGDLMEMETASLFDEQDHSPGRTRTDDHATSYAGADSITFRAGSQKAKLMNAYREAGYGGLTDEQAAANAHLPAMSCWWKRCNELREAGAIVKTTETRIGLAGVPRMVCRDAGATYLFSSRPERPNG